MAHTHPVVDSDSRFVINSTTRVISTTSDKLELVQGDHQSERITFEIPKIVEGHDMSLCDRIEVHYINIDRRTSATSRDVYIADDVAVDGDKLTFSWLISGNATKYYGRLNFIILFECLDPDGNYTYKWNTEICKLLTIGEGISNTSAVIEDHSDILEKFRKEILEEAGEKSIQPDWNQNDETAKDYVKNRTHYVSQESKAVVPEQEITTAMQNNLNIATLNDVDFDTFKTLFNSEDNTTFDVVFDGTSYQCKWFKRDGFRDPGFGNLAIVDSSLTDTGEPFCTNFEQGSDTRDIMMVACKTAGTHTVAVNCTYDVVHTIDPKYIKDMYYSEIAETIIGYGMNGWAVTTKNEAVSIPKMAIRGKVYENVPVDHTQMANVVYVVGGYTLTFNRLYNYMAADPSDLSSADVAFYGQSTVYHQMPAWAVNLGRQGIYVADATSSSKVVLDKMPEDCHFVVAINLSPSFVVDTVRYRGEEAPIISCKTKKQITNDAIPEYAMLLALTDAGWICVNPIA